MTALGLVETKGLLAAIEGADAMLKAADVRLLEKNLASGGLVTISIAGEVSAVAAAVSAAAAAISRIPGAVLVSTHVIPRPDSGLSTIIAIRAQEAGKPEKPAPTKKSRTADKTAASAPESPADADAQSQDGAEAAELPSGSRPEQPVSGAAKGTSGKSGKKSFKKR